MHKLVINRFRQNLPTWIAADSREYSSDAILAVHRSLPEYAPTPLLSLPGLALELGVGRILVKDEGQRFGLKAFKALGAIYAIYRVICEKLTRAGIRVPQPGDFYSAMDFITRGEFTFTTATDGNHGRGVAWTAAKLGQKSVIFMPRETVSARIESIRGHGAEVIIVDGDYDQAVAVCREQAAGHGWQIIADTSWPGYVKIPTWIQAAYTTIFREIEDALPASRKVDLVFVQGGVGALAATVAWHYNRPDCRSHPKIIAVEPEQAACLLESIDSSQGNPRKASGKLNSIMAGLNCGIPSQAAWPYIREGIDYFMTIADHDTMAAMQTYYYPVDQDPRIISGESGASSLAALKVLCRNQSMQNIRAELNISGDSSILLINTEGDTDPDSFRKIIEGYSP